MQFRQREIGYRTPYRRKGPRGNQKYIPIVDDTFWSRSEYHEPRGWSRADCTLPNGGGVGFSPVRVLNAAGKCVRVISVDELLARPQLPWNPAEPDYDPKRTSKRSTKRKYGPPLPN